jgi:DivIVA domain-containing protein
MNQGHEHPHTNVAAATSVVQLSPDHDGYGRLLSPADVRNRVFATVRLREGYDLADVDTFLNQVETTLNSVLRENATLRARLDIAVSQQSPLSTGDNAAHIVALAREAADQAVILAQEEARQIVADARDEAEAAKREALSYSSRMREGLEIQIRGLRNLLVQLEQQDGAFN